MPHRLFSVVSTALPVELPVLAFQPPLSATSEEPMQLGRATLTPSVRRSFAYTILPPEPPVLSAAPEEYHDLGEVFSERHALSLPTV